MEKILVAYFSTSGETARLAKTIADVIGGDLFEILPEATYPPFLHKNVVHFSFIFPA